MVQTQAEDDSDRKLLDDVAQYGFHIVGIPDDEEGPGFAFTVGLWQTWKHPELLIHGMADPQTAAVAVSALVDKIRDGKPCEDWHEIELAELAPDEKAFRGLRAIFRDVERKHYPEYLGYARWYYEGDDFPVRQVVWSDRKLKYAWQSECHPKVVARQKVLAAKGGWPFLEPKNRVAITTRFVLEGKLPITLVSHDADGDWQFSCGTTNHPKDARVIALSTALGVDPTVGELADLPLGSTATRASADGKWTRKRR